MLWKGERLSTPGEITDAALETAQNEPEWAPLFLAAYTTELAEMGHLNPALIALENLHFMASHFGAASARTITTFYGNLHQAREMLKED